MRVKKQRVQPNGCNTISFSVKKNQNKNNTNWRCKFENRKVSVSVAINRGSKNNVILTLQSVSGIKKSDNCQLIGSSLNGKKTS